MHSPRTHRPPSGPTIGGPICDHTPSRRTVLHLLAGTAAGLWLSAPARQGALAAAAALEGGTPRWHLGFRNAPVGGVGPVPLRRIHGRAPEALAGTLIRNGPGQFTRGDQTIGHWFDGDGLVRAFRIAGDEARLTARFVDTHKRRVDTAAGGFVSPGFGTAGAPDTAIAHADDANAANTAVLDRGDALWALWEAGSPTALDPETLATRGTVTLRDDLRHMPFSAHPKIDPRGWIWNFGLGLGSTRAFVWALDPAGRVAKAAPIPWPRAAYIHDFAVTEHKLIFPLHPWILSGGHPPLVDRLAWQPERGVTVLVVDKDNFADRRLFHLPAAFFFHTGDAWEDAGGGLHFDVCFADRPTMDGEIGGQLVRGVAVRQDLPRLCLVSLHPDGRAEVRQSDVVAEFPRTDARRQGQPRSSVWSVGHDAGDPAPAVGFNTVQRTDWSTGTTDGFRFGADHLVEEHIFVPAPGGGAETEGWLVGTSLNLAAQATELHVFDAAGLERGPLVTWRAPVALPLSFHGIWRW
ncbi:hypothetical protein CCR80_02565 [Rhodothalassium salexigens]|nr:hypothetical protein [Rhodothalassium salexigens]